MQRSREKERKEQEFRLKMNDYVMNIHKSDEKHIWTYFVFFIGVVMV